MVERNPWYSRVKGPFPESYGCVGVKPDGGGSMRGRGTVGKMRVHHAVFNRDSGAFYTLVPIRPRTRGERRSLRTFPGASLRPPLAFNTPCPRRLSTPPDAFQLHPDVRSYGRLPSDLIKKLIDDGDDVNEVEGAGNTPLFCAAYDGWNEGVELLCELGAKVNASNNVRGSRRVGRLPSPSWFCFGFFFLLTGPKKRSANRSSSTVTLLTTNECHSYRHRAQAGDTAWQWAANMMHDSTCEVLEKLGADKEYLGRVIVPEHIPKARPPASAFAFRA